MKPTVCEGLCVWSAYQPDRRIDFNGFWWRHPAGGVLIDPMPLDDHRAEIVAREGGANWVLLTNADHWRASDDVAARFGAGVCAPASERARLGERATRVDTWFESSVDLPEPLRADVDVRFVHGGKAPAEAVFFLRPLRALVFGDIVRSHESGRLRVLPDDKLADRPRVVQDLLALTDLHPTAVLLGDGDSLFTGARSAWLDFLRGLGSRG